MANHPNRSRRKDAPRNLVEAAYQFALQTHMCSSFAEFGREINEDTGRNDSGRRWREWRYGERAIPDEVRRYLVDLALSYALEKLGMDYDKADELALYVLPPERKE